MLPYDEMQMRNFFNEFTSYADYKRKIFPFLASWKLVEPYKTCARNIQEAVRISEKFFESSDDKNSYYHKSMKTEKFTKEE